MTSRPSAKPKTTEITPAQARQLALRAQGLWDAKPTIRNARTALPGLVSSLGAVQLDTISTLARSHQLVAQARLGGLSRSEIESNYWSENTHFEYWSHAACILPIEQWPLFEFRREAFRRRGLRWHELSDKRVHEIENIVREQGPVTTGDVGGGRKDAYWWNWSDSKVALEWLLDIGVLACTKRVGWRRQYDLAERVIPNFNQSTDDYESALRQLLLQSLRTLAVGTKKDILDVHRLRTSGTFGSLVAAAWDDLISDSEVVQVQIPGWPAAAYALSSELEKLDHSKAKRQVMLSPFDSLIWHRPRMSALFDMEYRIEAYTPAAQRTYGYFAMPVLAGDRLIARVDPNKTGSVLRAVTVTFETTQPTEADILAVANALQEAATWINADTVAVETCVPKNAKARLNQALSALGVK